MQLSSLIGKRILSPTGEQLGYVTGAYLSRDLKSLAALSAADGDEDEFILPIRAVQACGDAIIAAKSRITATAGIPAPIGLHAYSDKGEALGVVSDWLFGDCDPVFIVVKEGVRTGYAAETVVCEDNVVVYPAGERPVPKKRPKKKNEVPKTENEATMSENSPSENPPETESEEVEKPAAEPSVPMEEVKQNGENRTGEAVKFELGTRNLLGKRVVRSVFDAQGEIVALAGDRITPEVLSRARRKGRLLALTVNTLTNVY